MSDSETAMSDDDCRCQDCDPELHAKCSADCLIWDCSSAWACCNSDCERMP